MACPLRLPGLVTSNRKSGPKAALISLRYPDIRHLSNLYTGFKIIGDRVFRTGLKPGTRPDLSVRHSLFSGTVRQRRPAGFAASPKYRVSDRRAPPAHRRGRLSATRRTFRSIALKQPPSPRAGSVHASAPPTPPDAPTRHGGRRRAGCPRRRGIGSCPYLSAPLHHPSREFSGQAQVPGG